MTTTSFIAPNHGNTYIPMAEEALQANFSNNPTDFAVNRYVTVAKVQHPSHYDTVHSPDDAIRRLYTSSEDLLWADGSEAPRRFVKRHNNTLYTAKRWAVGFTIGDVASENATWDVIADHASAAAEALMVNRTSQALTALTTTGNWSGNTATASSLGGGQWDSSSATQLYIQKAIQGATRAIEKSSNRTANPDNLVLIVSPLVAHTISQTAEFRSYLGNSPFAKEFIQGNGWQYGLGVKLYGIDVVVENAVKNTNADNLTPSTDYVLGDSAILVQRPGSLQGPLNTMSTCTFGMYKDLSILMEHDNLNLLTKGVVFDYYSTIIRYQTGYLIQDVLA